LDTSKKGDERIPEGNYNINDKRGIGESGYYKILGVSYPNSHDRLQARRNGYRPGGDIKNHGMKNGFDFVGRLHQFMEWTNG
jgi:murein L,D-transpeptidase YafK